MKFDTARQLDKDDKTNLLSHKSLFNFIIYLDKRSGEVLPFAVVSILISFDDQQLVNYYFLVVLGNLLSREINVNCLHTLHANPITLPIEKIPIFFTRGIYFFF